jgi:RNA polymerase sigma factor (sigma-70 family)
MAALAQRPTLLDLHFPANTRGSRAPAKLIAVQDSRRWVSLVERIRAQDPDAMTELYEIFHRGVRFYLCRQLGLQEIEDKVHDTFLIVVDSIRKGELREPERLMGFVRTVVRRQVAAHIESIVQSRRERIDADNCGVEDSGQDPDRAIAAAERTEIMREALDAISERDREILIRFYLREQSQEKICEDMRLSTTQFRLIKSRAKARFGEVGRRKLAQRALSRISVRR